MRVTTSPPSYAECHEIWEPNPLGHTEPVTGQLYLYLQYLDCMFAVEANEDNEG